MSIKACAGAILVGAVSVEPATRVGKMTGWNVVEAAEEIDETHMDNNCDESSEAGTSSRRVTIRGYSRMTPMTVPAQDSGQALFVLGSHISFAARPNGDGAGKAQYKSLDATVLSRTPYDGEVRGLWGFTVELKVNDTPDEAAQT